MEAALYDPEGGFFSSGGGAGRAGSDFVTSPEVGSLFGVLLGRALDRWWDRLGHPDPFLTVEAGAGRGRLAADVLRAGPACAPALRYVLVERSAALRRAQAEHLAIEPASLALGPAAPHEPDEAPVLVPGQGPVLASLAELPAGSYTGVVVANELLDNLPFRLVERAAGGGWLEVRVGEAPGDGGFAEVLLPAEEGLAAEADGLVGSHDVDPGARLPVQGRMGDWLGACAALLRRGAVIAIDYADEVAGLLARGPGVWGVPEETAGWLRTYRAHRRGGSPLDEPGTQDITADVCLEALRRAAVRAGLVVAEEASQAEWLGSLGVEALVAEARAAWHARQANDLTALAARSRVQEADALLDPAGLGGHRVIVLAKGL
jgi:NADH dehydrogenase [ubiquinone] 1 alpha subcomplex assembly factor 7